MAQEPDAGPWLLKAEFHRCDVRHRNPCNRAADRVDLRPDQDGGDLIGAGEFAFGAHDVAPFAFVDIAGGQADVGVAERCHHLRDGQPELRQPDWIDDDPHLQIGAAEHDTAAHARDPAKPFDNHVLGKLTIRIDRPIIAGGPCQDEPGNRVPVRVGSRQDRLVGFVGVAGHPVEPIGRQQQGPIHVRGDREFQRDLAFAVARTAGHLLQPFEAAERFFLTVDDLAFHLCRGGTRPVGGDLDDRPVDVGAELDRDRLQRDKAEHDDHQHRCDDRDGAFDGDPDQVHPLGLNSGGCAR